jgi:hypothetical protein
VSALNAGSTLQATAIISDRSASISDSEPMNNGLVPNISALPSGTQECSLVDDRWKDLSRGIQQRLEAVDAFLTDVTTHRKIPGFLRHHPLALKIADSSFTFRADSRYRSLVLACLNRPLYQWLRRGCGRRP